MSLSAVPVSVTTEGDLADAGLPLFVYGSLLDHDVIAAVLARPVSDIVLTSASLSGFRRQRVRGECYPVLVPHPETFGFESVVEGALVDGLSDADLDRIHFYEGEGYALRPLTVVVGEERRRTRVRVFLATSALEDSDEPWDLSHWQRTEKTLALLLTRELMACYDADPTCEIEGPLWDEIKTRCHALLESQQGVAYGVLPTTGIRAGGDRA